MGKNIVINNKSNIGIHTETQRPNKTLLNKLWIIGNIREVIKTFQEANKNELTTN